MSMQILIFTSLDIEQNNPFFRLGALQKTLIPIINQVKKDKGIICKYLIAEHIYDKLAKDNCISESEAIIVRSREYRGICNKKLFANSYISHKNDDSLVNFFRDVTKDFDPNIVLVWETASEAIRLAFDKALVIDLMPGFMSRPPYPKMISIDPCGLYRNCWYKESLPAAERNALSLMKDLKKYYENYFDSLNAEGHLRDLYGLKDNEEFDLIPLQITDYFGFKYNCRFENQYDYLKSTLSKNPEKKIIATQYVGGFVSEIVLNNENIDYLNRYSPSCVLYSPELNAIDSISQFIIPYAQTIYSISSTLGLQAVFFGKQLVSESTSHLKYVGLKEKDSTDAIISKILTQGQFFYELAISDSEYFKDILIEMFNNFKAHKKGVDILPKTNTLHTNLETYINLSKLDAATRTFKKVFQINSPIQPILHNFKKSISSSAVKVVSFDVFDTLLKRDVGDPRDVFYLIKTKLSDPSFNLDKDFVDNFVTFRQTAEKLLRRELDDKLLKNETHIEEFTISDVYHKIQEISGRTLNCETLIRVEQEVELSTLKPRRLGKILYEYALSIKKKIIVISDFIHNSNFVKEALRVNGYNLDSIYVSSDIKLKKHTGSLFNEVIKQEKILPSNIFHVGDNPIGDVKRAREAGIRSMKFTSNSEFIKQGFKKDQKNYRLLCESAFLRQAWHLYADRYYNINDNTFKDNFELVTNAEEIGYIYIGPIMYAFAESIINTAIKNNIKQIVFFARDCWLPYIASKKIISNKKLDIVCCYLQISRKSATGIDILSPNDAFKVRIDDYSKDQTFSDLLKDRFLISENDVASKEILESGILKMKLKDIDFHILYYSIFEILKDSWLCMQQKYECRRNLYRKLLIEEGIDLKKQTIGVDIGYKGSIHKKISSIFTGGLKACLFMSYSNGYGNAPMDGVEVFFAKNLIPADKEITFLSHNLLFETLINQGEGTAINIIKTSSGKIKVIKDQTLPNEHKKTINKIHQGAFEYFNDYINVQTKLSYELASLSALFGILSKKPSQLELLCLRSIVFDNSYSGNMNMPFITNDKNLMSKSRNLWPEAYLNVNNNGGIRANVDNQNRKKVTSVASKTNAANTLIHKVVDFVVKITASESKYKKFLRDPKTYFQDSKSFVVRSISAIY